MIVPPAVQEPLTGTANGSFTRSETPRPHRRCVCAQWQMCFHREDAERQGRLQGLTRISRLAALGGAAILYLTVRYGRLLQAADHTGMGEQNLAPQT